MTRQEFEGILNRLVQQLTEEAREEAFTKADQFENRVREVAKALVTDPDIEIDMDPPAQAFPDVAVGEFGIEVKFTTQDTWRSVANSILETNRVQEVKHVYLVFGKMGGTPQVKWNEYEKCVMHVRTSHVPRFEVEIGTDKPLFQQMGVTYDEFRNSEMHEKMEHIRGYARSRLKKGERLWWLEDTDGEEHSLPIQARLYTKLDINEKTRLRAEAVLLCPRIVESGRSRDKYDDVVLFLLTYHGVLCHQARDLFSAGSVANPKNDDNGGIYIERAIKLIEPEIQEAALRMDAALFEEYWGRPVPPEQRIEEWLRLADGYARDWVPSEVLFLDR
ncbi:restriction endonuclease [Mariprofundus erugo]|uniref:restriction endonuclease n=1 Tax=Mariprofundus erugo TaxID=2528639 RepID=UPI0010FF5E80|nr:restriction endonuclease [Mariprofundus erugo]TLS73459.1 restriction endonuclease [Mariprofundus erugo]